MEINSLIFKNPVLKKNMRKRCPLTLFDFAILLQCVVLAPTVFFFFADDYEKKIISPVSNVLHLDGSMSILKNELVVCMCGGGGGVSF